MEDKTRAGELREVAIRWRVVLIPLAILLALIVWRFAGKISERAAQNSQRAAMMKTAPNVAVAKASIRDIVQTFDAIGNVEAPLSVNIAPKITGRIMRLDLQEGDRVRKGQVLVRIDPSEVEAQVRQAQAAVAEAQYRLAQAKITQGTADTGVSTQLRQQQAAVASAKADYNQARENYSAQLAAANAGVADAEARIRSADAAVAGAQASIKSAQANLENARVKYDRVETLYGKGFVSGQAMDDAKATLGVKEADLEVARGQLGSATAARESAAAQKRAAEEQASIVKTKGKADVEAAKARLDQAEAALEYAQSNTSQKAAYQQSISALKSAVDAAKAGLRAAQSRRADTVLVSPLDGYVTGRHVDPGAVVTAGQPAISVQFIRQIWVSVAVPEEIVAQIHIGQPARITLDALPGRSFVGSIIQINPSADTQSRQFTVRVIIDNSRTLLKPGMFAHVKMETGRLRSAIAVPREAVHKDDAGEYVMVVGDDSKAEKRHVITGPSDAGFVSVRQGLDAGETVVTMSAFPVREGQLVRVGGKREGVKPK